VGVGLSNDEIANAMVLSPAIAKTHVSRAMIKLGARDRRLPLRGLVRTKAARLKRISPSR
jgi:DNA-binding NarL/FixJ family response regulator